jgi:carbon monoxide dehydrogenase subunit G
MTIHMTLREEIAAPPDRVFEVLTDLDGASRWMPNFVRIEKLTPGPLRVGSQWRETRKMFGKESTEQFEVTGLERDRSFELFIDGTKGTSKRGQFRFRYDLSPQNGGTVLTLSGEIGGIGIVLELLGRLFAGMCKKAFAKDLAAMKRHIETAAAVA